MPLTIKRLVVEQCDTGSDQKVYRIMPEHELSLEETVEILRAAADDLEKRS